MVYLVVMAVLLFVPAAVFYAAYHLADHLQSIYRMTREDRNLINRGILMAKVLRK